MQITPKYNVTLRCSGVLKKGLNTEIWIDFFA